MCEFHNSNSNGLGDIWWTDKCSYFSSIDCPDIQFIRTEILTLIAVFLRCLQKFAEFDDEDDFTELLSAPSIQRKDPVKPI